MTKEEAIELLEDLDGAIEDNQGRDYDEAFRMAIEALKVKTNGDTISRADAMGAVQDHFNADGFKGYCDGQQMMDRIKALPSAKALTSQDLAEPNKELKGSDLIRREDAIKAIRSTVAQYVPFLNGVNATLPMECEIALRSVPSAEPKTGAKIVPKEESDMYIAGYRDGHDDATKTGEWIRNDDYICDQCGYHMIVGGGVYNFCPNCGADMR